jgi:hypothetical protein
MQGFQIVGPFEGAGVSGVAWDIDPRSSATELLLVFGQPRAQVGLDGTYVRRTGTKDGRGHHGHVGPHCDNLHDVRPGVDPSYTASRWKGGSLDAGGPVPDTEDPLVSIAGQGPRRRRPHWTVVSAKYVGCPRGG